MSCLENNGYETPELNEKLYLHFKGFKKIENLDRFTGCKALWLDSNGFDKIENLDALVELRCLYLSKNLIKRIDGLECLVNLTILDLSYNHITTLENLSCCPNLQTLNVSHNAIATMSSIEHLMECQSLNNLDITNNRLETDDRFFDIMAGIPKLVALSCNGNEITKMPSFRKTLLARVPALGYVDRPVDVQERIFAVAFIEGGAVAETAAREQWKTEQEKKRVDELTVFREWQAEQRKKRAADLAMGISPITEVSDV